MGRLAWAVLPLPARPLGFGAARASARSLLMPSRSGTCGPGTSLQPANAPCILLLPVSIISGPDESCAPLETSTRHLPTPVHPDPRRFGGNIWSSPGHPKPLGDPCCSGMQSPPQYSLTCLGSAAAGRPWRPTLEQGDRHGARRRAPQKVCRDKHV